MSNVTNKQRLLAYLENNEKLTVRQARARFRIANVSARIHELREDGYDIYTNVKVQSNGKRVYSYSFYQAA